MDTAKVAIIGAGVAGLACARALRERGHDALVYDKGRGPGGRCSSRRTPFGRFDHGAQFFTVRDERFERQVDEWLEANVVAEWTGRHVEIADGIHQPYDGDRRFVGAPAMNAFVRYEAEAAGAAFGLRMGRPIRQDGGRRWALQSESGQSAWAADWLVFAVPAEQVPDLVPSTDEGGSDMLSAEAMRAGSDPTWTLMAAFERDAAPFDAASFKDGPLAWVSREGSKPGRDEGARWVAHASPAWTSTRIEAEKSDVIDHLVPALRSVIGEAGSLVHADAHRWRYAQVRDAAATPFGLDENAQLATCGDWRIAPRVESAWVSGDALGRELAARLS